MPHLYDLGRLDLTALEREFGPIQTSEIIITAERIEHIRTRHPDDYALFERWGKECAERPDMIIRDMKHTGTVFMVKRLPETNLNVVVRVVLERDQSGLKNSVMTFYRIRDRNLEKLTAKNKLLYKREE